MNQRCIDAFGASARMCTTADVANTGLDVGPTGWVHPVLQVGERTTVDGIDDVIVLDVVSGNSNFDAVGPALFPGRLSCQGWTANGSFWKGLVLSSGRFALDDCDETLPVLCCTPPA